MRKNSRVNPKIIDAGILLSGLGILVYTTTHIQEFGEINLFAPLIGILFGFGLMAIAIWLLLQDRAQHREGK